MQKKFGLIFLIIFMVLLGFALSKIEFDYKSYLQPLFSLRQHSDKQTQKIVDIESPKSDKTKTLDKQEQPQNPLNIKVFKRYFKIISNIIEAKNAILLGKDHLQTINEIKKLVPRNALKILTPYLNTLSSYNLKQPEIITITTNNKFIDKFINNNIKVYKIPDKNQSQLLSNSMLKNIKSIEDYVTSEDFLTEFVKEFENE